MQGKGEIGDPLNSFQSKMSIQSHVEFYGFSLHLLCVFYWYPYNVIPCIVFMHFMPSIPPSFSSFITPISTFFPPSMLSLPLSIFFIPFLIPSEWLSLGPAYVIVCVFCAFLFHYGHHPQAQQNRHRT